MSFENDKKVFSSKSDKSKKKSVDVKIKKLVNLINSLPNYYTTSSCSGRVVLLKRKLVKKKSEWLFVSHDLVSYNQLKNKNWPKEEVWFKLEPLIMHVCCKTIEDAKKFLGAMRKLFKRTGIISFGKKITIEVIGNEHIDTIISRDRRLLVTENYLKNLVKEANKKLKRNFENIERFYNILRKKSMNRLF